MNNIFLQINSINKAISNAKVEFAKAIVDKSYTLVDRWELFIAANDALKNKDSYAPNFTSLPDDFIIYDGEIHMERHQSMSTTELVSSIEEMIECIEDCSDTERERIMRVNIDALKEEILSMNLGSFTYDW